MTRFCRKIVGWASAGLNYDTTVQYVVDDQRKRTSSRRAPPIQSEVAGDYSQTWNLNLNLQSTQNLATSLRLFGGRLRWIGGHQRSSEILSGMPKMGENLASNRTILISKIGTATGVAMPKQIATSRRRPESASDGWKNVRSVSGFCSNNPGFTHRRRITKYLWLSHYWTHGKKQRTLKHELF